MTENTPGEWTVGPLTDSGCSVLAPYKESDDDVAVASYVAERDAHLIAAAPDLLEALVEARSELGLWLQQSVYNDEPHAIALLNLVDEALARAKGQTP